MKKQFGRFSRVVCAALALFAGGMLAVNSVQAMEIDQDTAFNFASGWLEAASNPFGQTLQGKTVQDALPIKNEAGEVIAWNVKLAPEGFMLLSADDRLNPVLMVSAKGVFDESAKSPLRALVLQDMAARIEKADELTATRGSVPEAIDANQKSWSQYASGTRTSGTNVISDVWVDSFVETKWAQDGGIYNYYTPYISDTSYSWTEYGNPNNIVCGCVATGSAQLARYFQWPQKAIGNVMGSCTITMYDAVKCPDPVTVQKRLMGGDGQGGAYDWSLMSAEPSANDSPAKLKQVGALCLDMGLAQGMQYNGTRDGQSAANYAPSAFTGKFKYAGARSGSTTDDLNSNLDARRPVAWSIADPTGTSGHAIVCDGYGTMDGRWYYHLNMGWSGSYNGWYNLYENFYTGSIYAASSASYSILNMYRQKLQKNEDATSGSIASGRVTDANGSPVAGVKFYLMKASDVSNYDSTLAGLKNGTVTPYQTMLVWNEPLDATATPVYRDWDQFGGIDGTSKGKNNGIWEEDELPGAEMFRTYTDAKGIWAIDKIAAGDYYIFPAKGDLNFAGSKKITVSSANLWGLNFIASEEKNLALDSWWYEDGLLTLKFNRALGKVSVDISKLKIGDSAISLTGGSEDDEALQNILFSETSNLIVIRCNTQNYNANSKLSIYEGFLYVDVDGSYTTDQTASSDMGQHNVSVVSVVDSISGKQSTTAPTAAKVTAIRREEGKSRGTKANELVFRVTYTGEIDINDFAVRSVVNTSGKRGSKAPEANITGWADGLVTVACGTGDGTVRVDYVPKSGNAYLNGEDYYVDNMPPVITAAELSSDNKYVTVTWSEPVASIGENTLRDATAVKLNAIKSAQYAYTGDLTQQNGYAIWTMGAEPEYDGKWTQSCDEALVGCTQFDVASSDGSLAISTKVDKQLTTLTYKHPDYGVTLELGKFMYHCENGENGEFNPDTDYIFLKLRSDWEELMAYYKVNGAYNTYDKYSNSTPYDEPATYDPATDSSYFYGPAAKPAGVVSDNIYDAKELDDTHRLYYRGDVNWEEIDAVGGFSTLLNTWKSGLDTGDNGIWVDHSARAVTEKYDGSKDTLRFGKATVASGKSGSVLPNEIVYIDLDGDSLATDADFVFFDNNGNLKYDDGDTVLPGCISAEDVVWDYAILDENDFNVLLHRNGGTVTACQVKSVKDANGNNLNRGTPWTQTMQLYLQYSPSQECDGGVKTSIGEDGENTYGSADLAQLKCPAGVETIEIRPYSNSVYDKMENVASISNTTGEMLLNDSSHPRLVSAVMGHDNYSVELFFSKRIFGNSNGLQYNYVAPPMGAVLDEAKVLDTTNFTVQVHYVDGDGNDAEGTGLEAGWLTVSDMPENQEKKDYTYQVVKYAKGGRSCILDFFVRDKENLVVYDGRKYFDVDNGNPDITYKKTVDGYYPASAPKDVESESDEAKFTFNCKPDKIKISFKEIYDFWGNELTENEVVLSLRPSYTPGMPSTMPPMFSNEAYELPVMRKREPNSTSSVSGLTSKKDTGDYVQEWDTDKIQYDYFEPWGYCAYYAGKEVLYSDEDTEDITVNDTDKDGKVTGSHQEPRYSYKTKSYDIIQAFRSGYTVIRLNSYQKELYTTYNASGTSYNYNEIFAVQPGIENENGVLDQLMTYSSHNDPVHHYGVWYRDLDGDGRIDAVDLNFRNPRGIGDGYVGNASLKINEGILNGSLQVYVQNNDPEDEVNSEDHPNYYPADEEASWSGAQFNQKKDMPANTKEAKNKQEKCLTEQEGWTKGWTVVTIKSYGIIEHRPNEIINEPYLTYNTLRLYLNQNQVRPRTHGERFIAVTYTAPKYYSYRTGIATNTEGLDCYDNCVIQSKTPALPDDKKTYNKDITATNTLFYTNDDNEAGIYWEVSYETKASYNEATVSQYYICDSFGPVMAWDGAAPVPVSATAWRATPYPKKRESADISAYEYMDVRFSEPLAYVSDTAMENYGYDQSALTTAGAIYGPWGAEILDDNVVRFKAQGTGIKDKAITFSSGYVWDKSGGVLDRNASRFARTFSGSAIGIKPVDSRYRVLSTEETVPMFTIAAGESYITSKGGVSDEDGETTMGLSMTNIVLRGISQGGDFRSNTADWYYGDTRLGNASPTNTFNVSISGDTAIGLKALPVGNTSIPGSSVLGGISSITVKNSTYAGYSGAGEDYTTPATQVMNAPEAFNRLTGTGTEATPVATLLSGPVYNAVKVFALNAPSNTTRIVPGKYVDVLGLDIAAKGYSLAELTVRAYDTSYGQFDPSIDLMPLASGDSSGIQLVDVNNGNKIIDLAFNGNEWSSWKKGADGLLYKEVTLRPLSPITLPEVGSEVNSCDFKLRVLTSTDFNLGASFVIQIPDNGVKVGTYQSVDDAEDSWGTASGTRGFAFTDYSFYDNNGDSRWGYGDAIKSFEDAYDETPLYDGGRPYVTDKATTYLLSTDGSNTRNLFYAKKDWSTNPETSPFYGYYGVPSDRYAQMTIVDAYIGSSYDVSYNVSYAPGDDVWYDIGGEFGVYDEGIDIPVFGNADKFALPYSVAECGARSEQYRAAPQASAAAVTDGTINAPTDELPVAVVGLNMQDAGRGFGPRYILNGAILVETLSKNTPSGETKLEYFATSKKLSWKGGTPVELPDVNERAIILDSTGDCALVVRRLADDNGNAVSLPESDATVAFSISADDGRDIEQPAAITGVRIHAVGRANEPNVEYTLTRSGTKLSWDGGAPVDCSIAGSYMLYGSTNSNYVMVEVADGGPGGATSEELTVYAATGRSITPFLNIRGVEIMAVSDMVPQGYYGFSFDGASQLSWGTGNPASISTLSAGEYRLVYGDGDPANKYPANYVLIRRKSASLASQAVSEQLFVNQSQLTKVVVTLKNVRDFTASHLRSMTDDGESGISLWWDANADGKFGSGDMNVKLLETPVLSGTGTDTYTCTLTPDPAFLTAWLSCPQDSSFASRGHNFFVCVHTTEDMSYGDQFSITATFYEPTDTVSGNVVKATTSVSSGTLTCTSVTNTNFAKLTTPGQSIDANETVGLFSIEHFIASEYKDKSIYITNVHIRINTEAGNEFNPDDVFCAMDDETASKRGILLYHDGNDNGTFEASRDTLIPCTIYLEETDGATYWQYMLSPTESAGESCIGLNDGKPDHFLAVQLADKLPYGISFSAKMDIDFVEYNTGKSHASDAVTTDVVSSTVNSQVHSVAGFTKITETKGIVINGIGSKTASGNYDVTLKYNPTTNTYSLNWNGYSADVSISETGTYILGDESANDYLKVTFDPASFFMEDTVVCGVATATLGAELTSASTEAKLTYNDANGNGEYDAYEAIAYNGNLIYPLNANLNSALCTTRFTVADCVAFEGDSYDGTSALYHDSDGVYSLPWMARMIDSDNFVTPLAGGASSIKSESVLNQASSVEAGVAVKKDEIYFYYIDSRKDGRGYVYGEDIIVARKIASNGTNGALEYTSATDKVVLDTALNEEEYVAEEYQAPTEGTTLVRFASSDYLRYQAVEEGEAYQQGDALLLAVEDKYETPEYSWQIRLNGNCTVRRYNSEAAEPFDTYKSAYACVAGLDVASSGSTEIKLTKLVVSLSNEENFSMSDLNELSSDGTSGISLWRDADGDGNFNPDKDILLTYATPQKTTDGSDSKVTFSPTAYNEVDNVEKDGIYDFFLVVLASDSANNKLMTDDGDKFNISIKEGDVVLTKTINSGISMAEKTITIDSKAPAITATSMNDSDKDGYIESLVIEVDEALRPECAEKISYWNITDAATGAAYTVTDVALSEDAKKVTLTFAWADEGTTSGPQKLNVTYDEESALLDWVGNPVEIKDVETSDGVVPQIASSTLVYSSELYNEETVKKDEVHFYFRNYLKNSEETAGWNDGEDIWYGSSEYSATGSIRVWNGGNSWTTPDGYSAGKAVTIGYCDANENDSWDQGEYLWIEVDGEDGYNAENGDIVIPLKRTEEVIALDDDNDGYLDHIRVLFSENIKDSTLSGYDAQRSSYTPTRWSLSGYSNLLAIRGYDDKDIDDARLYFTFDKAASCDTGTMPYLTVSSGETLSDLSGNKLAITQFTVNDSAKPVLVGIKSSEQVTDDGDLPAGTKLTLTFSETLVYAIEGNLTTDDFAIAWDGSSYEALDCSDIELSADGKTLTLTLSGKSGIADADSIRFKIKANDDSRFMDVVGNALYARDDIKISRISKNDEPVIESPVANSFTRSDSYDPAIKITLNSYASAQSIQLSLKAGETLLDTVEVEASELDGSKKLSDKFGAEWYQSGTYQYTLTLILDMGEDVAYQQECLFYAAAESDVLDAGQVVELPVEMQADSTELTAKWEDFAKANGLPSSASYDAVLYKNNGIAAQTTVTAGTAIFTGLSAKVGDEFTAKVTAKNGDGVVLATATSNVCLAVAELHDTEAPVISSFTANGGESKQTDKEKISWSVTSTDNVGVTSYKYQVIKNSGTSAEWTAGAEMNEARVDFASVAFGKGILVAGGMNGRGDILNTAEIYYKSADCWNSIASMKHARELFAMAVDGDKVVVAGGYCDEVLDSIEVYSAGKWSVLESSLSTARYGLELVSVGNGIFWAIGGNDANDNSLASIEIIDINADTVTAGPNLSSNRTEVKCALLTDAEGKAAYIAVAGDKVVDIINLSNNVVSAIALNSTHASGFGVVAIPNANGIDDVWVLGGEDASGNVSAVCEKVVVADKKAYRIADMDEGRLSFSAVWIDNTSSLLVAGGYDSNYNALNSTITLVNSNGATWIESNDMIATHAKSRMQLLSSGDGANAADTLMVYGGYCGGEFSTKTEYCNTMEVLQAWTEVASSTKGGTIDTTTGEITGLALVDGCTYVVGIKAYDAESNESEVSTASVTIAEKPVTAVVSCSTIEDGDTAAYDSYQFTVSGDGVKKYVYQLDGGAESTQYPVSEIIALTDVALGSHTLKVTGYSISDDEGNEVTFSWTRASAEVKIVSGLPENEKDSYSKEATVVLDAEVKGTDAYTYQLNGGDISDKTDIATAIKLNGLEYGQSYTLTIKAYCGDIEGAITTRKWNVVEPTLNITAVPELPGDGEVTAAQAFTVSVADILDPATVTAYRWSLYFGEQEIARYQNDVPYGETFDISGMDELGSYTLKIWEKRGEEWMDESSATSVVIPVALAQIESILDKNNEEPTIDEVNEYTVTVNLNELSSYQYKIDNGALVDNVTDETFKIGPLEPGEHTISVWGVDANNNVQPTATTATVCVTSGNTPSGAVLTATITADGSFKVTEEARSFEATVEFSERIMGELKKSAFTVSNCSITAVAKESETTYTLTVVPDALTSEYEVATIALPGNAVYAASTGNGNKATGETKVTVYAEELVALSIKALDENGEEILDNAIMPADVITVQVYVSASAGFRGGDMILKYDTAKFECTSTLDSSIIKLENAIEKSSQCKYVDEGDKSKGIYMSALRAVSSTEEATELYAELTFKALANGEADETKDLVTAEGDTGFLLGNLVVAPGLGLVELGGKGIAVEFEPVTIAYTVSDAEEGGNADVTAELSNALTEKVTLTVNGQDYEIPAGSLSVDFTLPGKEDDMLLTGDQSEEFTVTVEPASSFVSSSDTLTVVTLDDEAGKITFEYENSAIDEGEIGKLYARLPAGCTVGSADALFNFTVESDTMISGTDYWFSGKLKIQSGAAEGYVEIFTEQDGVVTDDRTLDITVTSLNVGSNKTAKFQEAGPMTLTVKNVDEIPWYYEDGTVDIYDIMELLSFMGCKEGDEGWNSKYDLDENGEIGYGDLFILLSYLDDGTRSAVAAEEDATRSNPVVALRICEASGRTSARDGETLTFNVYAKLTGTNSALKGLAALGTALNYAVDGFAFQGEPEAESLVNTAVFNLVVAGYLPSATLDAENGSLELYGTPNTDMDAQTLNNEVLFATVPLKVIGTAGSTITVGLDEAKTTATARTGFQSAKGTLDIDIASPVSITVEGEETSSIPAFKLAFDANLNPTRGTAELILGMKAGASDGYDAADGDSPAWDKSPIDEYRVAFSLAGRSQDLKADIRGLSDAACWNVDVYVKAGSTLELAWNERVYAGSTYTMPEYFDFTLVNGGNAIDMRSAEVKSITFEGGNNGYTGSFQINVTKREVMPTVTYSLAAGWNLIGVPFDFDEESIAKFASYSKMVYDATTQTYVTTVEDKHFAAGTGMWVYADAAAEIEVRAASIPVKTTVSLVEGWNLVSPVYSEAKEYELPDAETVPNIWYWGQNGYEWIQSAEQIDITGGYWIYSNKSTVIW